MLIKKTRIMGDTSDDLHMGFSAGHVINIFISIMLLFIFLKFINSTKSDSLKQSSSMLQSPFFGIYLHICTKRINNLCKFSA